MVCLYPKSRYDVHMPRARKRPSTKSKPGTRGKKLSKRGTLADRILRIGKDCAARLEEPYKSMKLDEWLYDENGLPR